jgi:hypothetical protein
MDPEFKRFLKEIKFAWITFLIFCIGVVVCVFLSGKINTSPMKLFIYTIVIPTTIVGVIGVIDTLKKKRKANK